MTVATLFTPKITPQFDAASIDAASTDASSTGTDWDSYALDTDVADESDEFANDNDMAEPLSSNQLLPTETAQFRKLQKKLRRQVSWRFAILI